VFVKIYYLPLLLLTACKTDPITPLPVSIGDFTQDELFDPNRVLEVALTLDPDDGAALAAQTRNLLDTFSGECTAQPFASPFTFFPASISIDNKVSREQIGLRKKGFLGSLNNTKPSLKIDLEEFFPEDTQEIAGLEKLTFNNANQDPSLLRTCLAYQLFTDAGLEAPRCNFAHITANGDDLGVYVQIESINKDFVKAHFANAEGNLYEGTLSDFRPEFIGTFEKETNKADPARPELDALTSALTLDDTQLLPALDAIVDLEKFFTFWAMEVLTNHWDGYTNNTNNFYLYKDPTTNKLVFIVSGPDGAFLDNNPFPAGANPPISVFASGLLAHRLYLNPEGQTRFLLKLNELLETVYSEASLNQEIDRLQTLLAPFNAIDANNLAQVRSFIDGHRAALIAELSAGAPAWPFPVKNIPCTLSLGQIDGTFSTQFGTLDDANTFATGVATCNVTEGDTPLILSLKASASGLDPASGNLPQVRILGLREDGNLEVAVMNFTEGLTTGSQRFDLLAPAPQGVVGVFDVNTQQFTITGFIAGEVNLTQASQQDGGAVTGDFQGEIVSFPAF
jgi:hypothetical protein